MNTTACANGPAIGGVTGGEPTPLVAAVLGGDGGIFIWRVSDEAAPIAQRLDCGGAALAWCGAAAGGTRLVTTGADKAVRVWRLPNLKEETATFHAAGAFGSSDGIGGEGSFGADGALAVGDGSGRLHVLRLRQPSAAATC